MGVTSPRGLGQLRGRLGWLASRNGALEEIRKLSGQAQLNQLMNEFREGRDPYGHPWAPVKRGGSPLLKTGRMRASAFAHDGRVTIGAGYSKYHQSGTNRMMQRMLVPDRDLGLGERWRNAIAQVVEKVMKRHFK